MYLESLIVFTGSGTAVFMQMAAFFALCIERIMHYPDDIVITYKDLEEEYHNKAVVSYWESVM